MPPALLHQQHERHCTLVAFSELPLIRDIDLTDEHALLLDSHTSYSFSRQCVVVMIRDRGDAAPAQCSGEFALVITVNRRA